MLEPITRKSFARVGSAGGAAAGLYARDQRDTRHACSLVAPAWYVQQHAILLRCGVESAPDMAVRTPDAPQLLPGPWTKHLQLLGGSAVRDTIVPGQRIPACWETRQDMAPIVFISRRDSYCKIHVGRALRRRDDPLRQNHIPLLHYRNTLSLHQHNARLPLCPKLFLFISYSRKCP